MSPPESARLLKAESVRGLGSKIVFNYDDLRQRCDDYVAQTRTEAHRQLTEAQAEATRIREEARKEGFDQGRQEGLKQGAVDIEERIKQTAQEQVTVRIKSALPALQSAAHALDAERDRWVSQWETTAVQLSVRIAERILRQELHRQPQITQNIVTAALQLAAGTPQIRLRMHPQDVAVIGPACRDILKTVAASGSAELIPDPQVTPGGCVIDTSYGTVDAQLETQLAQILQELSYEEE